MIQSSLIVSLVLLGTLQVQSPAETEARRLATAAIQGNSGPLVAVLDSDSWLEARVGASAWRALTRRQQDQLAAVVRQRFLGMLLPPRPAPGGIAWSAELPSVAGGSDVLLGLRLGDKTLKTRWRMRHSGAGWRVADVVLSDPGISLGEAAAATLGPRPLRPRRGQARAEVLALLAGLAVILLVVALAAPRLPVPRRKVLYLAALVPALLFLAGAGWTAVRMAAEPYVLELAPAREPWRTSEELALKAQREGQADRARGLWTRAIAAGAPPGPLAYEIGLAARQRGDTEAARQAFLRALEAPAPAPGAARELAAIAAEEENLPEAEREIARYLGEAGPDPDSLSLQAVILANLGKASEAVPYVAEARRLVGEGVQGAELEARIRAKAADAAGAVAALRSLAREGLVHREDLRKDPAYLPIATDPVWVRFLNEELNH
jgi:tetratricopeptide (TPR) repeat protein